MSHNSPRKIDRFSIARITADFARHVRANKPGNHEFRKLCKAGVSPVYLGQAGCPSHKILNTPPTPYPLSPIPYPLLPSTFLHIQIKIATVFKNHPLPTAMDSRSLAQYIEASDSISKPWMLLMLRLSKLQEQKDDMLPEDYMQQLSALHEELMGLGEWWVGIEDEVFNP
jgi:hypothetical protein